MSSDGVAKALERGARDALGRRDLAAAEAAVARLEAEAPLAAVTEGLRLEVLRAQGRQSEARRLAPAIAARHPASPGIQLVAGQLFYGERDYARALEHLRESERLLSRAWTRVLIGRTLTQLGRLDEAEATLTPLAEQIPVARRDLAWLYERRGEDDRALGACERYLAMRPEDPVALAQRTRLRARTAGPERIIEEVGALSDVGEPITPGLIPEYVDSLLRTGRSDVVRTFLADRRGHLDTSTITRTAWVAYRMQAYDVALDLFLAVLDAHLGNPKFHAALEAAARRAGGVERLVEAYEARAADDRRLYGRLRSLRTRGTDA